MPQVFSRARVLFSVDGEHYNVQSAVEYEPPVDHTFENARNVTVRLHNATAKFVKLQLYFALRWILISEVAFDSGMSVSFWKYTQMIFNFEISYLF